MDMKSTIAEIENHNMQKEHWTAKKTTDPKGLICVLSTRQL